MSKEIEQAVQRFAVFATQVLEPAIHTQSTPLAVAVFQCLDSISLAEAMRQEYRPVPLGWRWGPVWSTTWFRITGRVPAAMAGRRVVLRFSSGTEALLWLDGAPQQGFDPYHTSAILQDPAQGGEDLCLYVEAACNRPFGVTLFWWDAPELHERWSGPDPGRLTQCELAAFDPALWRLWRSFEFARQLLPLLPDDAPRTRALIANLERVVESIDPAAPASSAASAEAILDAALRGQVPSQTHCLAVGHAHIDTAWLWPLRETQRKCLRSFASVLALMDQYPRFHFLCSQAQHYVWIEQHSPELFARIAARVDEGRWEPAGAMWVEPDCNIPSGESLVRQILHGTRYWQKAFGPHGAQRLLYLPDTFGFSAAIPQIMALAGLDTFVTNKLSWNETNEFPHTHFRWRGLDGTEVLAHCTPGRDYNATLSPLELQRGEKECARKDHAGVGIWLQPFGYGDGGGGPTAEMIENAQLAGHCEGVPRVTLSSVGKFCTELHRQRDALRATGHDLPVWEGELYLEYHRGTYTTQAWLKRANRQAEQGLRAAEWLSFAGPTPPDATRSAEIARQLDEAWKLLLLNQFHDILPGSSITTVYEEARRQHDRIRQIYTALIADGVKHWAQQASTTGLRAPILVFNPASIQRSGVVEYEGQLHYVANVPALGSAVRDRAEQSAVPPVSVAGQTLSNGILTATIDDAGRVSSLRRTGSQRETGQCRPDGSPEPLNQLVLYHDRPRNFDAWDLDREYELNASPVAGAAESWQVVETGPLRASIEVTRPLGRASHIRQRFILEAGSPRLNIRTSVEWHEEHRLLRALSPVDVRARHATYEVQFGHIQRPAHRNTSWDRAMFEVCAQRWADLSEPGFGVALLNDCKYGHSCHDGVLGLSLLRSPKFPDPQADMGTHGFTYSLMIHDGNWRAAGVDREAEALNAPLFAIPLPAEQRGTLPRHWAPFEVEMHGAAGVAVSAVKRAADDERLIIRLIETHGGQGQVQIRWRLPVSAVEAVDLLERPITLPGFVHAPQPLCTSMPLRPFQMVTLAARCR